MKRRYTEDERVIGAFLHNFRMVDVMKELKISKNTAYKIRNDPDFQKVLQERKDAILKTATDKVRGYLEKDVDIMQKIIEDPETAPQVKANTFHILATHFKEWETTTDILSRLEALENTSNDVFDTDQGDEA